LEIIRSNIMSKKKIIHRKVTNPKTTKEATTMIAKAWLWLSKKYPVFILPLTLWMIFGGVIYFYNYMTADKFQIKEAQPISQFEQPKSDFSIMPYAVAAEPQINYRGNGIPIVFNNQLWGYEDTTLVVKAVKDKSLLLVYNKKTHKVYQVVFESDTRMKYMK